MNHAYVVESTVEIKETRLVDGQAITTVKQTGTARVWVDSEERAREIVADGRRATPPVERTYRAVPLDAVPEKARVNLLRARAEVA